MTHLTVTPNGTGDFRTIHDAVGAALALRTLAISAEGATVALDNLRVALALRRQKIHKRSLYMAKGGIRK